MTQYDALVLQILEKAKLSKKEDKKEDDAALDAKKADLDHDGKLSKYEQKRGEAIAKAIKEKK